jgi:tRNA-specific 2-thiouridylase
MGLRKKVVVAMSGGVDSSVALARLKELGYDCIGVSMQLWDYSEPEGPDGATPGSCCTLDDINDARAVADRLDVPFYVVNVEEAFRQEVVEYFARSYIEGETPNPCIKCNDVLKFDVLLKKALALGADALATGHYARVIRDGGTYRLLTGVDTAKDQSYFLFTMTQAQLSRVLFPVGELTKAEVREYARAIGLRNSDKEESQEICFVEDAGYADFLSGRGFAKPRTGEIMDLSGRTLGTHSGTFNYTVGQRKGLNLSGGPHYVVEIDAPANRVVVGPVSGLMSAGLMAREVNWIDPESGRRALAKGLTHITARTRYRHPGAEASVICIEDDGTEGCGHIEVRFTEPERAVAPGQAVVFYRGDEVLGGGWIERALK